MNAEVKEEFDRLHNLAIEAGSRANHLQEEVNKAKREERDYTNKCISLLTPFGIGDIIEYTEKQGIRTKTIRMIVKRFAFSWSNDIYVIGVQVNKKNELSVAEKRFSITDDYNPFKSIIKKAE